MAAEDVSLAVAADRESVISGAGTDYISTLETIAGELKDEDNQNNLGTLLEKQNQMTEAETEYQTTKGTVNKATKTANEEGKGVAQKGS